MGDIAVIGLLLAIYGAVPPKSGFIEGVGAALTLIAGTAGIFFLVMGWLS